MVDFNRVRVNASNGNISQLRHTIKMTVHALFYFSASVREAWNYGMLPALEQGKVFMLLAHRKKNKLINK